TPPHVGRACTLALILTAHGLIAKLGECEIEGARHASYFRLKSLSSFGRIFVFNVAPLALAAGQHGFAEIHAPALKTSDFHPSTVAAQRPEVLAVRQGDRLPIVIEVFFVGRNSIKP